MWIFLTLGMVVLAHLLSIGLAMMALAVVAGVVLLVTRPRTGAQPETEPCPNREPSPPISMPIPRQIGEREPKRTAQNPAA